MCKKELEKGDSVVVVSSPTMLLELGRYFAVYDLYNAKKDEEVFHASCFNNEPQIDEDIFQILCDLGEVVTKQELNEFIAQNKTNTAQDAITQWFRMRKNCIN